MKTFQGTTRSMRLLVECLKCMKSVKGNSGENISGRLEIAMKK